MNHHRWTPLAVVCATVCAASGAALSSARAQSPTEATTTDAKRLERVEVTGSNIKRLAGETASPVQTLNRDDIRRSGASTLRQMLDTLMAADTTTLRDNNGGNSFASGASGVGMRGLGKAATLLLVDGRRIAPYGLADGARETFSNIDAIPLDVIDRIEVLKDGASAIYGSDAMAGVINLITRRDHRGFGVSATQLINERPSAGGERRVGLVSGWGDLARDRFNVLANLESYQREAYPLAAVMDGYPAWHKGIVNPAFGDPSSYSFPGNIRNPRTNAREPVAGCATLVNKVCVTDVNALTPSVNAARRTNLHTAARARLTEELTAFAEWSTSRTRTDYNTLPMTLQAGATSRWYDGWNRLAQSVPSPKLGVGNPANPYGVPVGIDYRFMDDPAMFNSAAPASQFRAMAGLQGTWRGLDWEVAGGRVGAKADKRSRWGSRELYTAVSSGAYRIGGPNSPELLARLFPVAGTTAKNHQDWVDAKLSGELMALPGGPLSFAAGAEHRDEAFRMTSTENVLKAQIIGRGAVYIDGSRKQDAAYAELNAPLLKGLELNGALRYDRTAGYDGHVSPKFGARFELTPRLLLRGTLAGGFRAPNIPETMGQVGVTGFFNNMVDPRRCEVATRLRNVLKTGTAADASDAALAFNSGCLASMPVMISSNPALKPETSRGMTLGLVFEPTPALTVAMDYFQIERRDEIASRDSNYVLSREGKPGYEDKILRGPLTDQERHWVTRAKQLDPKFQGGWDVGQVTAMLLQYENFGRTRTSGVDIDIKGRVNAPSFGLLKLGLSATHALRFQPWDIDANTWRPNQIGGFNSPRLKAAFSANWEKGAWATGLRFTYTSRTTLNSNETDESSWGEDACRARLNPGDLPCFVDEDLRTDFNLAYTGFTGWRLGLNVLNLMGDARPVNLREGFSVRPRVFQLGLNYTF